MIQGIPVGSSGILPYPPRPELTQAAPMLLRMRAFPASSPRRSRPLLASTRAPTHHDSMIQWGLARSWSCDRIKRETRINDIHNISTISLLQPCPQCPQASSSFNGSLPREETPWHPVAFQQQRRKSPYFQRLWCHLGSANRHVSWWCTKLLGAASQYLGGWDKVVMGLQHKWVAICL